MRPPHLLRCFAFIAGLAAALFAFGSQAQAVTVTMVTSNTTAGTSWATVGSSPNFTWSDQVAAHSGADYIVGANLLVRAPNTGSSTFPGDSLTLQGQFNLASSGSTVTVSRLTLSNGSVIANAVNNSTQTLAGSLSVESGAAFIKGSGNTGATDNRNIVLTTLVSGAAEIRFLRRGTFTLNNAANTFSGTWRAGGAGVVISGGNPAAVTVSNHPGEPTILRAASGSLGVNASVVMEAESIFEPQYDWTTTGSLTLNANSRMTLNQPIRVEALTIGGVSLPAGSHSFAELVADHAAYFTSGGTGVIVVGGGDVDPPDPPNTTGPALRLTSDTVISPTGLNFPTGAYGTSMNGQTFQQEGVISYNGWQYAAYFDASKRPAIARRSLPDGAWEQIVFNDYGPISHSDVHNVNVVGICPEDGSIHLAFDHHNHPLRYRRSIAGVATNPAQHAWTQSLFSATTSQLEPGQSVSGVSYPQFFTSPQGKLQFCFRIGSSGNGDWHLYEYSAAGWERLGMLFSREGTYSGKNTRSAYPNQFRYDRSGRLHITWSWREAGSDLTGNHDLGYAYSTDFGRTWRNNAGDQIALLDGATGSAHAIKLATPGHVAYPIRYAWGYMNTTTQAVDAKGRVHVISWRNPDDAASSTTDLNQWRYFHYWRDTDGTWRERLLPFHGRKPQLVLDDLGNMYLFFGQGSDLNYHDNDPGARLAIATATEASGWTDWKIVSNLTGRLYHGEPLLDLPRWERERILSVYHQERPSTAGQGSALRLLDFTPKSERELWNEAQFGEDADDPQLAGDQAAPAGDNIPNLVKYAFGLPAAIPADPQLLPQPAETQIGPDRFLTLTYRRRTSPFSGLTYQLQGSDNLTDWLPLDPAPHLLTTPEPLPGGFERIQVRTPTPINGNPETSYFLRIKVINTSS